MTAVALQEHQHVAVVEFENGPANYFTVEILTRIADLMDRARESGARAIVLTSRGRHFCAGADFSTVEATVEARGDLATRAYAAGFRIFAQPLPIIAAIQGAAVGGGLGLACAADFRVVSRNARLEANFTRLGFHPGFGLSVVLPRLIGHQAASTMLLEGQRVNGIDAVAIGLADELAEPDALFDAACARAIRIAERAPLAVQSTRRTLRASLLQEVEACMAWEGAEQKRLWATEDAEIGMAAALRRETPQFKGA